MISIAKMKKVIKNKNNIIPMVGITIATLIAAAAVTAIFTPTLYGLLSAGVLIGAGLTPVLLGVIAVLSLAFVLTFMQQLITAGNTIVLRGPKGEDGKNIDDVICNYMLNNLSEFGIKTGNINKDDLTLQLSDADYKVLTEGKADGSEVSLYVSLHEETGCVSKEVEVKFNHVGTSEGRVRLTAVNGKNNHDDMEAELNGYSSRVVVCNQPIKSLGIVDTAIVTPAVHRLVQYFSRPVQPS